MNKKLQGHLLILLAFAGLSLLMTWPVVSRISTHLAGGRDDLWVHQWTFWWIRQALAEGLNPFFTPYLYFPEGVSLTSHNIAWFNIALWLPLQTILGHIAAYNLVFLAIITLNGFCMYLFAYTVTKSRMGAFIAGLIFGFWPYTLSHYDHANMMVLFWVPLSLYLLNHLVQKTAADQSKLHWWWLAGAALSIAMIGISRWQLLIMSSPILITYTIYILSTTENGFSRRTLLHLLLMGGLAVLIMTPLATPLLVDQYSSDFPEDVFLDEPQWGRTDLLAYVVPSIHNTLWRNKVAGIYENFVVNQFYTPHLGFITLLLVLLGLLWRWKNAWLWLLLALLYFVLALGPVLAVNGREFALIPMPYRLLEDFILLRLLRRPDRLNIFLSLPIAMIAAWGTGALMARIRSEKLQKLIGAAVILLVLVTYSPIPFATTEPQIPIWYARAAADGEEYAILDLPINDRSYDKWYMQYQTTHGKPLVTGHVSRLPAEAFHFLDNTPILRDLRQRDQLPDPALTTVTEQLSMLQEANIRYLVIHKAFANEGLQNIWRDWLTFSPSYEDEELIVYRTRPTFGQDFTFVHALTPELGLIDIQVTPAEAVQSGTLAIDARWGTAAVPQLSYDFCLHLISPSDVIVQTHCLPPDSLTATKEWPANTVLRGSYDFPISQNTEPGPYKLAVSLDEPGITDSVGQMSVIGDIFIHPFSPPHTSNARWQDELYLAGYDLEHVQDSLKLILFWQVQHPIESSYKVFVHLVNKETGEIVAQSDALPRDWQYPTTSWKSGEIVRDVISLPLTSSSYGNYELHVGLYDELTGQRLLLESSPSSLSQEYLTIDSIEP